MILVARWFLAMVVALVSLSGTLAAQPLLQGAGGVPCRDGVCLPNTPNFGYYQTRWRRWPTSPILPAEVARPLVDDVHPLPPAEIPEPPLEGHSVPPLRPLEISPGVEPPPPVEVSPPVEMVPRSLGIPLDGAVPQQQSARETLQIRHVSPVAAAETAPKYPRMTDLSTTPKKTEGTIIVFLPGADALSSDDEIAEQASFHSQAAPEPMPIFDATPVVDDIGKAPSAASFRLSAEDEGGDSMKSAGEMEEWERIAEEPKPSEFVTLQPIEVRRPSKAVEPLGRPWKTVLQTPRPSAEVLPAVHSGQLPAVPPPDTSSRATRIDIPMETVIVDTTDRTPVAERLWQTLRTWFTGQNGIALPAVVAASVSGIAALAIGCVAWGRRRPTRRRVASHRRRRALDAPEDSLPAHLPAELSLFRLPCPICEGVCGHHWDGEQPTAAAGA